jgi:hypothetical protein
MILLVEVEMDYVKEWASVLALSGGRTLGYIRTELG